MSIDTADVTDSFNALMDNARKHLEIEHKANRIRGNDYATVLTATIGQAMQVAASYSTAKAQVDLQTLKSDAEIALLNQKKVTEDAQTQAGIADPDSVVGKQLTLYTHQAEGYIQDAKVKTANLFKDILAVQLNINENITTAGTGFENAAIKLALDSARNGIGAIGNVTAPTITMVDPGSVTTPQGTVFTDPGATAVAEDGTVVVVSVSGAVDHTITGSYNLVYTATDANGLTSNLTRTVEVI